MSNHSPSKNQKNHSSDKLVPALRFPEFKNAGEWEETSVENVAQYENGKAHEQDISEKGDYIVVNSKFISTDGEVKKFTNTPFCIAEKDDILMVLSDVPNGRAMAKCFLVDANNKYTVNQRICKITPTNAAGLMLFYALNRNPYFLSFDDGVKQTNLRKEDVLDCPLLLPKDTKEQQKIADCLSSLDELIDAETQVLDTLKDHKKGLMQQLFPAEGEKVPKLRFAGFKGEWEEKTLGELGQLVSGLTYSPDDVREEGLLVLRSSNIQNGKIVLEDCVYVKAGIKGANISKPNDILICVRNGSKALIGKNALIPEGMPLSTHGAFMSVFRSNAAKFVYQLFQTNTYTNQVASDLGATINSINGSQFVKYKFYVPKDTKEQHKIAECFSAIDDYITAQSEKIEQLKAHKKGLMQRLFPSPNDIDNG